MIRFFILFVLAVSYLSGAAFCEEAPVRVTAFELKDGKTYQAVSYASVGKGDFKSYVILTPSGQRLTVLETEIVSRKVQTLPLEKFPEATRNEILKNRALINAVQVEADAEAVAGKSTVPERRKEYEAFAALSKVRTEFSLANSVLLNAQTTVRNAPIDIARADARYDAAKVELNNTGAGTAYRVGSEVYSRADYLRNLMMQAAEEKARLEAEKKEAEETIKKLEPTIAPLGEKMAAAMSEFAAAQAETRNAFLKARDIAEGRVAAPHGDELSIRKTPEKPVAPAGPSGAAEPNASQTPKLEKATPPVENKAQK